MLPLSVFVKVSLLLCFCQVGADLFGHVLTVCPEEDTKEDCVTLQQLVTNQTMIKSHTTIKFVPATFSLGLDVILTVAKLSNITLDVTAPPARADLVCVGNNWGFMFDTISGLVIRNLNFYGCGGSYFFIDWQFSLAFSECTDVMIQNINVKHGNGCGVFALNTHGSFITTDALFASMNGTSICIQYDAQPLPKQFKAQTVNITISRTKFTNTTCASNLYNAGAAVCIIGISFLNEQLAFNFNLIKIDITRVIHGFDISNVYVSSKSSQVNRIALKVLYSVFNSVINSNGAVGGSDFAYVYNGDATVSSTTIEILDSMLASSVYKYNQFDPFYVFNSSTCGLSFFTPSAKVLNISIINTRIANNTGEYGTAICTEFLTDKTPYIQIVNSMFFSNNIYSSDYFRKGVVVLKNVAHARVSGCDFTGNSGTGLLLQNTHATLEGINVFRGNKAYNGGGMALWDSSIELLSDAIAVFGENVAEHFGAGLYVTNSIDPKGSCFITKYGSNSLLKFYNNSAKTAGSDLYGGHLYRCTVNKVPASTAMAEIIRPATLDLTSDPFHICDCSLENSTGNCISVPQSIHSIYTLPGRTFSLKLLAVGQLVQGVLLSGVPTAIYASLLPPSSDGAKSGSISNETSVQNGKRACSVLKYQVYSTNKKEVMVLTVNDNAANMAKDYFVKLWQDVSWKDHIGKLIENDLLIPIFVEINFIECPIGFELSIVGACICLEFIKNYGAKCSVETLMIERVPSYWLGLKSQVNSSEQYNASSVVYLAHRHCPFDYCKNGSLEFSFSDPDAQCSHNRKGILCGACEPSYSLVLGGSGCERCTHLYLLLLIPFVLAGIAVIIFISLTDMTVAAGTISGLIFYINVVSDNKATFFPQEHSLSFLSVFVAWLNLDFGINSCFYDGLDAYVYTWLQLAFPLYLWLLAFGIIIASRHLALMNKVCGRNIVPVLATLFLLSYTKLQNVIATGLSCTVIEASSGDNLLVWLKDGNIHCFQGKHLALFFVSCIFLLILLAYTLSLVLGPWLQKMTHYRVFSWVLKLKPLFDAYFGPLKDKHRYWIGVLLLSRLILCLISAVNVLGDSSINLLAICTVCFVLVALLWQSGGVYKSWTSSLIDSFFFMNLGILSSVSSLLTSSKSQNITIILFIGSAFAVFCLVVVYHCYNRLKQMCKAKYQIHHPLMENENNTSDFEDNDLIRAADENRDHAATERNCSLNADLLVDETY